MNNISDHENAKKLRDELKAFGLVPHLEEISARYDPPHADATYDTFRVWCEPKRLNVADLNRLLALQYEHYCFCHIEADGRLVFSGDRADA